jgi:hypothetical protein
VPDLGYDGLAIGDGETASLKYMQCIKDAVSEQDKAKIYADLKTYCRMDTLAEVRLLEVLYATI